MGAVNSHSHHIVVVRAGLHRADIAQEAQVAVAALQASAQGEGCPGMNTTYTVKHIQSYSWKGEYALERKEHLS